MASIKSEGYDPSYLSRPYRVPDGASIDTDYLSYAPHHPQASIQPTIVSQSPYGIGQPLPGQVEFGCSPHNSSLNFTSPPTQNFASLYGMTYKPAPQIAEGPIINYSPVSLDDSSVSPDSQRPSSIGKMPSVKSKVSRKMSMHDGRRTEHEQYIPSRPATMHGNGHGHSRAMSQNDVFGSAPGGVQDSLSTDTRVQGNSMGHEYGYSVPMPRSANSWPAHGTMGGYYEGSMDQVIVDSPITPLRPIPASLATDESSKRQKRRECHNQVEKRRREHINAKIEELGHLLPVKYAQQAGRVDEDDDEHQGSSKKKKRTPGSKKATDNAQCKGLILSRSVKYIVDLRHENEYLVAQIQQLQAALASSTSPVSTQPMQTHQSNYWNHVNAPARRDAPGFPTSPVTQATYQPQHMIPDDQLEIMPPSPEPEAQVDEDPFNMSWNPTNMSTTTSGSGSSSESPEIPANSDSTYSPDNGSSTLHSSVSHDSSPAGTTALNIQGASTGKSLQYPVSGNNGLGLEFVPGPMEMQVGQMRW